MWQPCRSAIDVVTTQLFSTFLFRYIDSTILLLPKPQISSLLPSSVFRPIFGRPGRKPEDRFSNDAVQIQVVYFLGKQQRHSLLYQSTQVHLWMNFLVTCGVNKLTHNVAQLLPSGKHVPVIQTPLHPTFI